MKKMRIFKFWNENGDEKEKEALSLKKAVMSVQGDYKDKVIGVSYTSKKGKLIETSINIPMGRKIRQSIIVEKRRAALKAKREAERNLAENRTNRIRYECGLVKAELVPDSEGNLKILRILEDKYHD